MVVSARSDRSPYHLSEETSPFSVIEVGIPVVVHSILAVVGILKIEGKLVEVGRSLLGGYLIVGGLGDCVRWTFRGD